MIKKTIVGDIFDEARKNIMKNLKKGIIIVLIISTVFSTGCTKKAPEKSNIGFISQKGEHYDFCQVALDEKIIIALPDWVESISYKKGSKEIILNGNTYITALDEKDSKYGYVPHYSSYLIKENVGDYTVYMEGNVGIINYVRKNLREEPNYSFGGVYVDNELIAHDFSSIDKLEIHTVDEAKKVLNLIYQIEH